VSEHRPNAWGAPPPPQQTQPPGSRQCLHCGWPSPAAEPVCRNCGTDVRVPARPPAAAAHGYAPGGSGYAPAGHGYGPAGHGYAPAAGGLAPGTNGLAIASLVLGILWLYWVGSILALVFGYIARRQIAQGGGRQGGRGLATAGIVLGWIGIGFLALFFMLAMVGLATDPAYNALPLRPLPS
jgi:hypothetical protein